MNTLKSFSFSPLFQITKVQAMWVLSGIANVVVDCPAVLYLLKRQNFYSDVVLLSCGMPKGNQMVSNQVSTLKTFYGWLLKRFSTNESSTIAHKYNTSYSLLQGSFPTMHMIFFPVHYIHGNHIILLMIHFIIKFSSVAHC